MTSLGRTVRGAAVGLTVAAAGTAFACCIEVPYAMARLPTTRATAPEFVAKEGLDYYKRGGVPLAVEAAHALITGKEPLTSNKQAYNIMATLELLGLIVAAGGTAIAVQQVNTYRREQKK